MIASPTKPEEALSLTCFRALDFSVHPFAIANPNATPLDGIAWLVEEVGNLHYWIDLVACSKAVQKFISCSSTFSIGYPKRKLQNLATLSASVLKSTSLS